MRRVRRCRTLVGLKPGLQSQPRFLEGELGLVDHLIQSDSGTDVGHPVRARQLVGEKVLALLFTPQTPRDEFGAYAEAEPRDYNLYHPERTNTGDCLYIASA